MEKDAVLQQLQEAVTWSSNDRTVWHPLAKDPIANAAVVVLMLAHAWRDWFSGAGEESDAQSTKSRLVRPIFSVLRFWREQRISICKPCISLKLDL
jgi:hypothetical protein